MSEYPPAPTLTQVREGCSRAIASRGACAAAEARFEGGGAVGGGRGNPGEGAVDGGGTGALGVLGVRGNPPHTEMAKMRGGPLRGCPPARRGAGPRGAPPAGGAAADHQPVAVRLAAADQ